MKNYCNYIVWILTLCVLAVANLATQAEQQNNPFAFVETKVVDSFSIGVRDDDGHTNGAPELGLTFAVWCINGWVRIALPHHPEYSYKVELVDANGLSIPKTKAGENVGNKFDEFAKLGLEKSIKPNSGAAKKGQADGWLVMVRPSDLFEIKKPGHYMLRIWFQIVVFPKTGPKRELIRFPPLEYPLVEPEPTRGNSS
jgi:hypothetical protein